MTDLTVVERRGHIVGPAGHTYAAHCNYYNCFLQKALLSNRQLDMEEVLVDTASMLFFITFARTFRANRAWSEETRLRFAQAFFRKRGYGNPGMLAVLDQQTITATASITPAATTRSLASKTSLETFSSRVPFAGR